MLYVKERYALFLLLAEPDHADNTTEGFVACFQRITLHPQHVMLEDLRLLFHQRFCSRQGRIGNGDVSLRHLQGSIIPNDKCTLTGLHSPRVPHA